MSEWMTLRVVLLGRPGHPLTPPPGRLLLAHTDHTFAELSEALDVAFGRWDLSPVHEFAVQGRRLTAGDTDLDEDSEDSDDVALGEVGLGAGTRFTYLFDVGEGWTHDCRVEETGVDPVVEFGETPSTPVPLYGWGTIPDQYGATTEEVDADGTPGDTGPPEEMDALSASWPEADPASWEVVAAALAGVERPRDDAALAAAAAALRELEDNDDWPYDVLWAAGGLDDGELPDDDEEMWLTLAAGVVAPRDALPLDPDHEAAWAALEPADYAGAVIELVRAGTGHPVDARGVLELIERCPEVEGGELTPEDEETLLAGLETVVECWAALGIIGDDRTLTALGRWGLPQSVRLAWEGGVSIPR